MRRIIATLVVLIAALLAPLGVTQSPAQATTLEGQKCFADMKVYHNCTVTEVTDISAGRKAGIFTNAEGKRFWCVADRDYPTEWNCEPLDVPPDSISSSTSGSGSDLTISWAPPPCVRLDCPVVLYRAEFAGSNESAISPAIYPGSSLSYTFTVNGGDWYTPHVSVNYGDNSTIIKGTGSNTKRTCVYPVFVG